MSSRTPNNDANEEEVIQQIESNLRPKIVLSGEGLKTSLWKLKDRMVFYKVPGVSLAFFEKGKIKWTKTYGNCTSTSQQKITAQTIFQAASISKPITAIGALQLVEAGKIDLDQPVNDYLKNWKIPENRYTRDRPVTLRNLLSHTSGATVSGFDGYQKTDRIPSLLEILDGTGPCNSAPIRIETRPGNIFKYSGGGYTIIQQLIEDVSGSSFQTYISENVFDILGMEHSFFEQPLSKALESHTASGHRANGEPIPGNWNSYPELAAAGLWTTPSDLALFAISIQKAYQGSHEEIISPNLAQTLLRKHADIWGLGMILIDGGRSRWFSHSGSNSGYRATLFASIDHSQGVVVMTNGDQGARLYAELLRSVSKYYRWDILQTGIKKTIKLKKAQLKNYVGRYVRLPEDQYQLTISLKDGALEVHQLWHDIKFPIFAEHQYHFFECEEGILFNFMTNPDGSIKALVINRDWVLAKVE